MNRTNREAALVTGLTFFDTILFVLIIKWIHDWVRFAEYDPTNKWLEEVGDSGGAENMMMNVIWKIHCGSSLDDEDACEGHHYQFDFLLGAIAFITWLKCSLQLKVSKTFGPLFKLIEEMSIDLAKFMVLWLFVIVTFTCVGTLIFGSLEAF